MGGAFLVPLCCIELKSDSFNLKYRKFLTLANCLSGGVFLATFFVGLMPEVRKLYHQLQDIYQFSDAFPLTEFVIFIGFLLALAIEQGTLEYKEKKEPLLKDGTKADEISPDNNIAKVPSSHGHSHHDIAADLVCSSSSSVRLGILLVSLGVHSLFEGLALGLQTSPATLCRLTVGVALHEILMAFALGVSVSRLHLPLVVSCKLALLFSASIPTGQLVGLLIGHYQTNATIAISTTLQGLAAGTFIHVTFMEIIPTEFNEKGNRLLKVFTLGLGFMLILLCGVLMENLGRSSHWK